MKKKIKTDAKSHSRLGASSSDRWFNCSGSVAFSAQFPNVESPYAKEGTAAHTLADLCLKENKWPADFVGTFIDDIEVTEEMADAVHVYVDYIRGMSKGNKLFFERKFHLSFIDDRLYGTNDAGIITPKDKLIVIDYKHGVGVSVDAERNSQLMYYTLGAAWDPKKKAFHPYKSFQNVIVQPRAEHPDGSIRSWGFGWKELNEFKKELVAAVARTDNDPTLTPGDHCQFCPALGQCPAVHKQSMAVARTDFAQVPAVEKLTPKQLNDIIQFRPRLNTFMDAVEDRARALILDGTSIDGLKLVRKRKNREWIDENKASKKLTKLLGDDAYSSKLRTPAQIEKILGEEIVEQLSFREQGELEVAPMSDKRKDETPAKAEFKRKGR
jgi:hypothetical protein